MYLEEIEQSDGAEQGPQLTDSTLTEQCQVAGLTEGNASAALDGNILAELSEQRLDGREISPSRFCMGNCHNCEVFADCGGDSERSDQYSGTGNILKCITSHNKTLRSSYPLERWYARPSGASEPCVRHRSAHDGCPCRTEQQQHVAHQDSDLAVDEVDMNSDTFEQCETCGCPYESREQLESPEQYAPSATRSLEHKPEASVEDPEKRELPVFVRGAFESADESDCDAELGEDAGIQNHRMVAEDNDEWGYLSDDSQERLRDDELGTVSEDMNWRHPSALLRVNFDKSEGHIGAAHENVNETGLTAEQNTSDKTSVGFLTEDDVSSDGSSSESFKTCAEDSENSLNSSESESEKEAPEDWSDDQTRWESCEDDEEPRNLSGTVHDEKKTSDFVLEDYFDLFDRADYHGPTLTQSQQYISCFDGGDIHDWLYGDQLQAEEQPQNARRLTETKPHRNHSSEKTFEGIHGCNSNRRGESGARPEDCKAQHELDDVCKETNVNEAKTCDAAEPLNEHCACQIKSLPTSSKQLPNSVVLNAQMISAPNEGRWVPSQSETRFRHATCPQESQVDDVNELCSARGESKASNEDSASIEISREVQADIIHSVVSEYDKTEEGDSPGQTGTTEDLDDEDCDGDPDQICRCDYCIPPSTQVPTKALLPQLESHDTGKICVVIDLDETLVHSSFTPVNHADFITPVDIDGTVYQVYVSKRPHVDEFLRRMGEMFECVLFTASLSKYADPVSDVLDKWGAFRSRLFREACVFHKGNYVKDLSHLGRDLNKVIIIDNSPASYSFHPDNAVPVASWFDDMTDSELLDLIPYFERLNKVDDVYDVLKEQRALG